MQRRAVLAVLGGLLCSPLEVVTAQVLPRWHKDGSRSYVMAAWRNIHQGHHEVGLLLLEGLGVDHGLVLEPQVHVQWALKVPSRPHGLSVLPDGSCLVAARRPGDWLMRVSAQGQVLARTWLTDDRRLNGHVLAGAAADVFYSTETDLENDQGLVVVRDVRTLEPLQEWATQGSDPHEMALLPKGALGLDGPCLMVANGGVKTLPDLGRQSLNALGRVEPLDSSLVALNVKTGEVVNTWRLADPWLSLRHLAHHNQLDALGVALQAHHPDVSLKQQAPIVAVLTSNGLVCASAGGGFSGYGGSIACTEHGFMVTSPPSNALAEFDVQAVLVQQYHEPEACALVRDSAFVWVGGARVRDTLSLELDNHWVAQMSTSFS